MGNDKGSRRGLLSDAAPQLIVARHGEKLPPDLIEHGDEKGKQPVTTESGKGIFAAMREMLD